MAASTVKGSHHILFSKVQQPLTRRGGEPAAAATPRSIHHKLALVESFSVTCLN